VKQKDLQGTHVFIGDVLQNGGCQTLFLHHHDRQSGAILTTLFDEDFNLVEHTEGTNV